jgi:Mrp family chromosome partitioning ATPase
VLFGLLSGKYRFAHDTEDDVATTSPLLAILPTVSENLSDLMQASDVAQSIHHLRVLLQAERKQQNVFMITSACSGEGKTSLAVSLGLSFAASGARTLLIDCDLVGQGITRGFGLQGAPGVREALAKNTARGSVKRMAHGMRLMPAGNADPYTGWTVSPYEIGKLVRDVRPYYEVILIDTGPILGSVEACVVAPEVDGVIMAISRGQQRSLVDRALHQVMSLGAKPAGFVFNRAKKADFSRSAFHSSTRNVGSSRPPVPTLADEPAEFQKFGPVVRAVAMFMPQLTPAAPAN